MRSNGRFTLFVLAVCVGGTATPVRGQEAITYRVLAENAKPGSEPSVSTRFREAEAKISQGAYDPAADNLLRGAERLTKVIFNVPSLQLQRAITERVYAGAQRGDVLIAEWKIQEPFGRGMVVLTDTPYFSNYALRLAACTIRSRTDLAAFLDTALSWGKDPAISPMAKSSKMARTPGMTVSIPTGQPISFFRGDVFRGSPYPGVADFDFEGLFENGDWFFHFRIGKSGTERYLGVPPWIPERFPRLSELVKTWSFNQILGEIGNAVQPFAGGPDFTGLRDAILIAELVRRGISDDQVIELLRDPGPSHYDTRLVAVSKGFRDAGSEFIRRYFDPALRLYEDIGPGADRAVEGLFRNASMECSPEFEMQAMAVLKRGVFAHGPLIYLGGCSTSRETMAALEAIQMPTKEKADMKERVLHSIQLRIEHPRKPLNRAPAVEHH